MKIAPCGKSFSLNKCYLTFKKITIITAIPKVHLQITLIRYERPVDMLKSRLCTLCHVVKRHEPNHIGLQRKQIECIVLSTALSEKQFVGTIQTEAFALCKILHLKPINNKFVSIVHCLANH